MWRSDFAFVLFVGLVTAMLADKFWRRGGYGVLGDFVVASIGALLADLFFIWWQADPVADPALKIMVDAIGAIVLLLSVRLMLQRPR